MVIGLVALLLALAACSAGENKGNSAQERGASLYAEHCLTCHGDAATGGQAVLNTPTHGPDGHTWHHADGQLVQIMLGKLDFPGKTMPSFEGVLDEEDVLDVLAYLKSDWLTEQREFQAEASDNLLELQQSSR